jgi:hypothetical protein
MVTRSFRTTLPTKLIRDIRELYNRWTISLGEMNNRTSRRKVSVSLLNRGGESEYILKGYVLSERRVT